MLHADAETVHRLLDYPSLISALRTAHATDVMPQTHTTVLSDQGPSDNNFVSLLAWGNPGAIAVKLVGVFPGNTQIKPPQPSVQGLVALFSGRTGAPVLTADGAALTFRKTAADSALGADHLARDDARTLVILGAGGLAPHMIEAHRAIRPSIERVLIWNRTPERAEQLAQGLAHFPVDVKASQDLAGVLGEADIVSCVTMATQPLVKGALLKPGCHVDLVGAYLPEMREADDDVVRRAGRVFVDTRAGCEGSGEISIPLALGLITRDSIEADLFDLCTGRRRGRKIEDEITVYKNVGGAHLDLFTASYLCERLVEDRDTAR
jgi:ornithine cyclodeaminase